MQILRVNTDRIISYFCLTVYRGIVKEEYLVIILG